MGFLDTLLKINFLQAILSGLAIGSIYALIAQGYYITNATTGIINFAQGDFLMMGALVGLALFAGASLALPGLLKYQAPGGIPFILVIPLVLLFMALMGMGLERFGIRPLKHFAALGWIMSTVGVGIILRNVALLVWGRDVLRFPSPVGEQVIHIGRAGVAPQEILIFVVAIATMLLLLYFLRNSLLGKALTAVAANRDAAALMGINVRFMVILSFILSSMVAGLGGILVAPVTFTGAEMGTTLGLKAFAAAIIGGLDNPVGILIGGLLIGLVEFIAGGINDNLRDLSVFILLILLLIVRPTGLFGKRVIQKV